MSTRGGWDDWITFFADGLTQSAVVTRRRMLELVDVQAELKQDIARSALRAGTAHLLIDFAVSRMTFTVRQASRELGVTYGRANRLVESLVELGVLRSATEDSYNRRFYAPRVLGVLVDSR